MPQPLNIADRLTRSAEVVPSQRAVVFPQARDPAGRVAWTQLTFQQLDEEASRIARGLIRLGVTPGQRIVLMVRPSLEFIALTFGLFRAGAVCTLIDPGMGRSRIFDCLDDVAPDGFVAIPVVHMIRTLMRRRFRRARVNVMVGRSPLRMGCRSYQELLAAGDDARIGLPQTSATDPAAIIFTSGSTGPPKGVLFEHGMFDAQVDLILRQYGIVPGETDLPGFPLFALFNLAMQVTTIIPEMDPTRPAQVNPDRILEAIRDQGVTQAFGSPALWNRVGRHCEAHDIRLPTINRILSAGAPVPIHVLERMLATLNDNADIYTPYGATECLPVASIGGREVIRETASLTAAGRGICVGRVFDGMHVKIIGVTDDPIAAIDQAEMLRPGDVGEIIVKGPVATREYFRRPESTRLAKISDGESFWHRMGDVGYFDNHQRLWFCGRRAHIVWSAAGPMYSVCCEAIFNAHSQVYRTALVGCGPRGRQVPVVVVEPEEGAWPQDPAAVRQFESELQERAASSDLTRNIGRFLFLRALPVDTRHNVKINREQLAVWAAKRVSIERAGRE